MSRSIGPSTRPINQSQRQALPAGQQSKRGRATLTELLLRGSGEA